MNPFEEWMIVWRIRYDGSSCVWASFREAFSEWRSLRDIGERAWLYPKLMLKGRYHRGLKEFQGW